MIRERRTRRKDLEPRCRNSGLSKRPIGKGWTSTSKSSKCSKLYKDRKWNIGYKCMRKRRPEDRNGRKMMRDVETSKMHWNDTNGVLYTSLMKWLLITPRSSTIRSDIRVTMKPAFLMSNTRGGPTTPTSQFHEAHPIHHLTGPRQLGLVSSRYPTSRHPKESQVPSITTGRCLRPSLVTHTSQTR